MHHLHSVRGELCLCWLHVGVLKRWVFRWRLKSSRDGWGEVKHSRQQERHARSLCWWGMICELVGVVEWWKMSEDQVRGGGDWGVGDRMDWMSREFDTVVRTILKMMRLWISSQCNFFRQSVLLRVGLRTSLASLFCTRCKEWIKEADVP